MSTDAPISDLKKKFVETTKGAVHVAAIALDVAASATQNVPYLGAISKVLVQVLKIIDEVDVCKSTWKIVMSKIQDIHKIVDDFRMLCEREEMIEGELPDTIKKAFKKFEGCLLKVIATMNDCKTGSKRIGDQIRLAWKRSELTAAANQCGDEVVLALNLFQVSLQIDQVKMIRDQSKMIRNQSERINDWVNVLGPHPRLIANLNSAPVSLLPPAPSIFHGRSVEVDHVVDLILNHAPAHVAIVGSGGIGKTSIALTSIHHAKVEKEFLCQRFFLSCEAILTAESLALELLMLFGLPGDSRGPRSPMDTLGLFVQSMTSKCLLCLDNFETPWDSDKDRIESLLMSIAVQHLTLIITSRDSDRPRGIKWTSPLLPPVQPLEVNAAIKTWDDISHGHDDFSLLLINAVDCIPLAITLLCQLAESDTSEALWASWNSESTRLVKLDGFAHRLNNLELSIELSLRGPRVSACSGALDFFIILCMLPQGLPESRIPEFETAFRKDFTGIRSAIRVLKQCSLAYTLDGFLRVLSPVRQYTQSHPELSTPLSTTLFSLMADLYFNQIPTNQLDIPSRVLQQIQSEIGNISAVLDMCLAKYVNIQYTLQKIVEFSWICRYLAIYDTRLLSRAASVAHDCSPSQEGNCYYEEAIMYLRLNKHEAENMLKTALHLHTEANAKIIRANDLRRLGELYIKLNRLEDAENWLQSALDSYTELDLQLGRANVLQELGVLYTMLNRLEDADKSLQTALGLHTPARDKYGHANDLQALGKLYTRLHRLEDAEKNLQSARILHTEITDRLGLAGDLHALGELYIGLNQLVDAEKILQSACILHTEVNDSVGLASDLQTLGELYIELNRLEDADKSFQSALDLYIRLGSGRGQGNALKGLGNLCITQWKLAKAEDFLTRAMDEHRCGCLPWEQQLVEELFELLHEKQKERADMVEENTGK
ncbi:hypothetical protein K438DRAFT_653101 [Mycena galopus ATCC 62051]|nr:hypothetical protein K438DRAFT_653101 [Mycena galopus ATCC 62051]